MQALAGGLEPLVAGRSVTTVALEVGHASVNVFVAAVRDRPD